MSLYEIIIQPETDQPASAESARDTIGALEAGRVLFLPRQRFETDARERALFTPAALDGSKNVSFQPATGGLSGTGLGAGDAATLAAMMGRFSATASALVAGLLPRYRGRLEIARASFRPAEIGGRVTSWRKDDTRLHVDSFPATPSGGRRILRLFTNVNPSGRARSWRIGGAFEAVAARFAQRLRRPLPGSGRALALVGITKAPRTPYDALMLQLHDAMKADEDFQRSSPQEAIEFPAGSTWIAFTDQVSHAAMAGQHQLEQTFMLPVDAMLEPERSPLRILERLKGMRLA
jgi:3-deoxy-D-manno-octulosonic acid hydroxylase-like protein